MTPEGIKFTKTEWIPALRSGKYLQGMGRLHDSYNRFCCLGVACDLLKDKLNMQFKQGQFINQYDYESEYLPGKVECYLGLDSEFQEILASKNDAEGLSFNQIADYLEDKISEAEDHVTVLD